MGHRTYLIKTTAEESKDIFEANNSLPVFWLTLIKLQDMEAVEGEMKKVYNLWDDEEVYEKYEEEHPGSAHVKVYKPQAMSNAQLTLPFINNNFPVHAALFHEFINYLDLIFKDDDILELDIISLANYSDIDIFIKNVKDDLEAIATQNAQKVSGYFNDKEFRYALTGFDIFEGYSFKNHSKAYQIADERSVQAHQQYFHEKAVLSESQKKKRARKAIILIIFGILFLYVPYRGVIKVGIANISVIACLLISLAAIGIGISKLKSARSQ
ncbi:MAG TPA: hypothetical protein VK609_08175 [Mucilaginibacter sp.]|nr:hypothetical protein [Mucilaginibacter sp.]